ncbi:MAG: methylated-DNA--[protein]-cysteine S-methyltransferase [Chloroflexota bacterium]
MNNQTFAQQTDDYRRIERAIGFLEANFRAQPSLEEMAASVHLSKYHFQRLFKRWAGISPTQFVHLLSVEYAKQRLQASSSVLDAALDVGLSGPGRLHDLFVTFEAVTPGEFKRQGSGLEITYGFHQTPFGECLLAITGRGICGLHFAPSGGVSEVLGELVDRWPQATLVERSSDTAPYIERLFAARVHARPQPFHLWLKGTNFQVNVWRALLRIPPGAMVSYQNVAAYLGMPNASRAVARAIASNPVAFIIPCHRVIGQAGQVQGYRWGTARKKAMLVWEAGRRFEGAGMAAL